MRVLHEPLNLVVRPWQEYFLKVLAVNTIALVEWRSTLVLTLCACGIPDGMGMPEMWHGAATRRSRVRCIVIRGKIIIYQVVHEWRTRDPKKSRKGIPAIAIKIFRILQQNTVHLKKSRGRVVRSGWNIFNIALTFLREADGTSEMKMSENFSLFTFKSVQYLHFTI